MSETIELDAEIARLERALHTGYMKTEQHLLTLGPLDDARWTRWLAWSADAMARLQKARSARIAAEATSDDVDSVLDWHLPDAIAADPAAESEVTSDEGATHQNVAEQSPTLRGDTPAPSIDAVKYFGIDTVEPSGCEGINTGKIVRFPGGTHAAMSDKNVRDTLGHFVRDAGGNSVQPGGTHIAQQNKGKSGLLPEACAVVTLMPPRITPSSAPPSALVEKQVEADASAASVEIPITTPKPRKASRRARAQPIKSVPKKRKRWRDLRADERFAEAILCAGANGGLAFSLNMNAAQEERLLRHPDPFRCFQKRISDALSRQGVNGLPWAAHIEVDRDSGKLHLHGVFILDGFDKETVKRALREAAGLVRKQHSAPRQLRLKPIEDAPGWVGYVSEDAGFTRRFLGDKNLFGVSQALTRLTKERYDESHRGPGRLIAGFAVAA